MRIESIKIANYKVFKSVSINNLPNMCVFLGANGSGKTTLFDVFDFMKDCLVHNVKQALAKRGGYKEVVSRGAKGPIQIEIKFRLETGEPLITYTLHIGLKDGMPIVEREVLKYKRGQTGQPWKFLDFSCGQGKAITNEAQYGTGADEEREDQTLDSPDILAIKGLGQFERFKTASAFRKMIENWYVSDFHINVSRESQDAGYAEHLSTQGENLPLVAQYMYQNNRSAFNNVLEKMKERIPGISDIQAAETEDGRIVLKFHDGSFKDPFIARYVSDGTIKMFAYLLLLYDPSPHPLLAIEEPENQLHPDLLIELAEEFRQYAYTGGQVFVSTHSPDFVNGVWLDELFWLTKENGFTTITRGSDNELLCNLVKGGDLPGALWKQHLFPGAGPR